MVYLTEKGKQYLEEWRRDRGDFSNNIPNDKKNIVFTRYEFPGVLGLTDRMSLVGMLDEIPVNSEKYEKIKFHHECRHDEWEYRTRVMEEESFAMTKPKEKNKYNNPPEEYQR